MLAIVLKTALALDCTTLNADSCDAANLLAQQINAEVGPGTVTDDHPRVAQRTMHLYERVESVRAHAADNQCLDATVTLVGAQGGAYDAGPPQSFGGRWSDLDGADQGVITDGSIDTSSKTFWGTHISTETGLEGDVGADFASYNASRQVAGSRDGGFQMGTWVRLAGVRGFYATVYGDCVDDPAVAFASWFDGEFVDGTPTVTLPTGPIVFQPGDSPLIAAGAVVTDNQPVFTSGQLSLTLTGAASDGDIVVPSTPVIGSISGNGTASVVVDLASAHRDDIAAVLDSTTLIAGAARGSGTFSVTLVDADGNVAPVASRGFEVEDLELVVGPTGDFTTLTAALAHVASTPGATGSTVLVQPGDYSGEGRIDIDSAGLTDLTLRGAAAGLSAGVVPAARPEVSQVDRFHLRTDGVVIDGFDLFRTSFGDGIDIQASDVVVQNCVLDAAGAAGSAVSIRLGSSGVTLRRNRFATFGIGAFVQSGSGLTIDGNAILVDDGIVIWSNPATGTEVISNNGFQGDVALQHRFAGAGSSNVITFVGNDLAPATVAIETGLQHLVNADGNWWGQSTGPLPGQLDVEPGTVTVADPLAADPFPAFP